MKNYCYTTFATLSFVLLTWSCAPLKITETSSELAVVVATKNTVGKYEFIAQKKSNTAVEILEVALLHSENNTRLNLSFSILDVAKKTKLLTLVDETTFVITGKTPNDEALKAYDTALIVYKIGEDGKRKTIRVKNIEAPK
ncbi:MAG: hypothetical protein LAT76_10745 [Schleiferiaceae bacterium]|nr:hypothetical protein [Schleiferiaceae bacterium]